MLQRYSYVMFVARFANVFMQKSLNLETNEITQPRVQIYVTLFKTSTLGKIEKEYIRSKMTTFLKA